MDFILGVLGILIFGGIAIGYAIVIPIYLWDKLTNNCHGSCSCTRHRIIHYP